MVLIRDNLGNRYAEPEFVGSWSMNLKWQTMDWSFQGPLGGPNQFSFLQVLALHLCIII